MLSQRLPGWLNRLSGALQTLSTTRRPIPAEIVAFPGVTVRGFPEYLAHREVLRDEYPRRLELEAALLPEGEDAFEVDGFCAVCAAERRFRVSFLYAYQRTSAGRLLPNWREHLVCQCGFGNRVRGAVHYLLGEIGPPPDARLFITEQTTPLYTWLRARFPQTVGSEYFGADVAPGAEVGGYRHEDLERLSFEDDAFDVVLSFDVLEHVADAESSFRECLRCLKPGGVLLFTAPFTVDREEYTIRAVRKADGSIEHLAEPEYHGNPIDPEGGSLCFRYFGWRLLADLESYGFDDPHAVLYWSRDLGYLGAEQILFVARKPSC
jgi:SAM-dependent methyltransferase